MLSACGSHTGSPAPTTSEPKSAASSASSRSATSSRPGQASTSAHSSSAHTTSAHNSSAHTTSPHTTSGNTTAAQTTSAHTTAPPGQPSANKTSDSIRKLTSYLGHGGVSIEAVDLHTGATYRYGATGGMRTGSIVKLYILETLLLKRQRAGTELSEDERELATRMIENSDNDAASDLWEEIGGGDGLRDAADALGVRNTQPDPDGYFGLTKTDAPDYIALLRNLTSARALNSSSRKYILGLMAKVEPDQRWGVSAAADPDTTVRLKNGWLSTAHDHGRWLVNSVGVITAAGDKVIVAVMTQHGSSFDGGINLVEKLAKLSVEAVTGA